MSRNIINPYQQFIDLKTGKIRASGILTFFVNTKTTKASIFSDEALSVAQNNPYTLNANGQVAADVKYSGLLTVKEANSDGSNPVTTDNVATIGDQTTIVEILGTVAGTNTITAKGTPTITSLVDKTIYSLTLANAITGAATVQIDATAAKSLLKYHDQPLISGDGEANQAISFIFNSTDDTFELLSSTLNPQIQSITATVGASALTLGLNPTSQYFRKTPLTDGTPNVRSNAALSLVVPSGATLGTTNAVESRLILLAIDNAGTVELAVSNSGILDETTLITTVAIDATADSKYVIYSTTARTSVPFRIVGFVESTQATAGTWATSPTVLQGAGTKPNNGIAPNHIRAGNTQIWAGKATTTLYDIKNSQVESTFETVGPTGSGADNIWTEMDKLPANATILIVRGVLACSLAGAAAGAMSLFAIEGDEGTPVAGATESRVMSWNFDADQATGLTGHECELLIPLGATNQDFHLQWIGDTGNTLETAQFYYKGFMTD